MVLLNRSLCLSSLANHSLHVLRTVFPPRRFLFWPTECCSVRSHTSRLASQASPAPQEGNLWVQKISPGKPNAAPGLPHRSNSQTLVLSILFSAKSTFIFTISYPYLSPARRLSHPRRMPSPARKVLSRQQNSFPRARRMGLRGVPTVGLSDDPMAPTLRIRACCPDGVSSIALQLLLDTGHSALISPIATRI